ncbi:hypothetical protein LCM4579_01000 [Ensifer sp. LCM 4579]|nr:hypothetical protein LCM4579_01000 [Ensifer sp. LCM 4579]
MKSLSIAIACLLWQPAVALSQDIVRATDPFDEHVLERSQVSTEIVMGVMLTGPGGDGKSPILGMELPKAWVPPQGESPAMFCVRVTSKDGRYASTNAYRVMPGAKTGLRRDIDFPSEKLEFLKMREAAVRVTRGDCHERPNEFALALWSAEEAPSEFLSVFLNAGGQRAAVASDDYAAHCIDETEEAGLKYTARCKFPVAKLNRGGSTTLYFTVNRNRTAEHFQIAVVTPEP